MIAKRWVRNVVAVGVAGVVAGVAGCSTPPAPPPAPGPVRAAERPGGTVSAPPSASAGTCPEGGVRLVETDGNAAMGLRVAGFRLENCGTEPYVLEGYPQVSLWDGRNEPVDVSVQHGAAGITSGAPDIDAPPQRVTLAPGRAATVSMVWRNLVTDAAVGAVTAPVVEVEPRPGAPRLRLRLARPVDLGNTGRLGLGPWRAAAG
ncbi:DUF4232 domain-containing protein [Streptomyces sp. NPDC058892]|uniref:DUF4232 domain-containing protein n=1 Tax=unclassified Streptomyces TaxID=2593676 RepID=UPI0006922986|nr:DUF4232 domain-containing protein [Streptomyces sp. PCS3-D2]WKV73947.1 DUF4232 domain-containing protein [Streptomyces sp. PCS3-D2]